MGESTVNMATGYHQNHQERVPENLNKQLALAIRSIQWSYAIFWSTSARDHGLLEWSDGYYNGDIKTRKTIQSVELNSDQMGLQRSEQLRELYLSLSAGETSPQSNRRPSAALSPEDLSDTEWYYLVCMSFVFNIGEGLPGRVLATGQPIWLCNAHYADSKVFSRSLLAKSASIETVVCFPFLQGVIELGAADLVMEDPRLIQHIRTSFLENPYPMISNKSSTNTIAPTMRDEPITDTIMVPIVGCEDVLEMSSPSKNSNDNGFNQSQPATIESWEFMEEELSNCVHHSVDSSDCISQTFVNPVSTASVPKDNKPTTDTKFSSLDVAKDDVHYQNVLSDLLKTSHQLILGPQFQDCNRESSFVNWKNNGGFINVRGQKQSEGHVAQLLLKKMLFEVPRMYSKRNNDKTFELSGENGINDKVRKSEANDVAANHVHGEKLNNRFGILKSLVPSINKVDKISILDDTIEYLLELERKVKELESRTEFTKTDASRTKKKTPKDIDERTSDNYANNKLKGNGKKPLMNKRKANCDIDEIMDPAAEGEHVCTDNNVSVGIKDKDVLIELRCPWREGILVEFMDSISNLGLDVHSAQSSVVDGIFSLNIKSKYKGSSTASAGMIKQSLQRLAWKC